MVFFFAVPLFMSWSKCGFAVKDIVPGVVVAVVLTYALIVSLLPPPHRPPSPTTTTTTADNGKTTPPTTGNITASADDSHASEHPGGSVVQVLFQIFCQNFVTF